MPFFSQLSLKMGYLLDQGIGNQHLAMRKKALLNVGRA